MKTLLAVLLAGLLATPSVGADPSENPLRLGEAGDTRIDVGSQRVFALRWRQPVVRQGFFRKTIESLGRPAISTRHGLMIVAQGEGDILAYDLDSGVPVWTYSHGVPFETTVTLVDVPAQAGGTKELALAAGMDSKLLAVSVRSGLLVWATTIDGDSRAPAIVVGSDLVLATTNNKVHFIDTLTGRVKWTQGRPAPSSSGLTVLGHAQPCVAGSSVYAGFSDGYVEAFALQTGRRQWSRPLSFRGEGFRDADADPVFVGGRLIVASYADGIFALDPKDGTTVWTHAVPSVVGLAAHKGRIIAASADGYVWGLRPSDGSLVYRTVLPEGSVSRPLVRGDLVAFAAGDAGLVVLDAETGRPVQATALGARLIREPAWVGDTLGLLSTTGYLYALKKGGPGLVQ